MKRVNLVLFLSWEDTLNARAETDNAMDVIANAMVLNFNQQHKYEQQLINI